MTTDTAPLFDPITLGSCTLENRIALAPMTRVSAEETGKPTELMAGYYEGFAKGGFGLLITEGIYTDTQYSQGYVSQPGLALPEQGEAWGKVVDTVHQQEKKIFAQLMHAGAQSQGNRFVDSTIGPSAVTPKGQQLAMYRGAGPYGKPAEITPQQMREVRRGFVAAARLAEDAGFDGIEIHGANGYLIDEFLTSYFNQRTDEYGGSAVNRVRFATEICSDILDAVGDRMSVGIRISQSKVSDNDHRWEGGIQDASDIFAKLGETGIHFIHTTEYRATAPAFEGTDESLARLAKRFAKVPVIANGNLDSPTDAADIIRSGDADVIALGKPALANRDWPRKALTGEDMEAMPHADHFEPLATVKDWELQL